MEELLPQKIKLIGRDEELNQLKKYLDDAIVGKGSTILLSGEAGIGKTRLVDEFLNHSIANNVKVLAGSSASDIIHPFLILSDALEKEIDQPLFQDQEFVSFRAIFAVNRSGLLVAQASSETDDLDADIFAGMLSAVQDFVRDSFDSSVEQRAGLGRLEYGDMTIMMEHGSHLFLTALIQGNEHPGMKNLLRTAVKDIEKDCGEILESWSGSMVDMTQIQDEISALANVKFQVRRDLVKISQEPPGL